MSVRVLYVDDDPDLREIAVMSLELDPRLEVRTVESGAAALDALRNWDAHLVLLDVMMPGMDGPATLASMRDGGNRTPVVFITAKADSQDRDRLLALGATGVIAKPFDPMDLARQVLGFHGG